MKKDIYLGMDGVILTKGVMPALHLDAFLKYITANFSVSWLSTRCRGSNEKALKYLSQFLFPQTLSYIKPIKPLDFSLDKTEAIDFKKQFFWLEVQLFDSEMNVLRRNNAYDSWIELDLIKNPNQLQQLIGNKRFLKNR